MIDRRLPVDDDVLVRDYLGRLSAAAAALPAGRGEELAEEVREHIDAALAEAGRSDEATVRNVLERLGSPEEIVAAEGGGSAAPGAAAPAAGAAAGDGRSAWGPVEIAAVVLLCVAWPAVFLPFGFILWLGLGATGLALVWASRVWPTRRKLVSSTCVVALYLLLFLLTFPVSVQCTTGDPPQPCPPGGPQPTVTGS
jgi:hypothetical protein